MSKKRFALHCLLFNNEELLMRMIRNVAPFVEKIYIAFSEVPWEYDPEARKTQRNLSNKDCILKSEYREKIVLIEGIWKYDEDQRNSCLQAARQDGFDYLIAQDCDEFYSEEDFKKNLCEIEEHPDWEQYTTPCCCYWKSLDYVLVSKEDSIIVGRPLFALNCKKEVQFVRARIASGRRIYELKGMCHHLSYVLENEDLLRKITTWGHAHQFDRKKWYEMKWLRWNENTLNLHPVEPEAWKKTIRREFVLPEILKDFQSPNVVPHKTSLSDKLKATKFYLKDFIMRLKRKLHT